MSVFKDYHKEKTEMKIKPLKVTVKDVVSGYVDNSDREEGIYGYSGKLNIRPKYQRNYVYDENKRNAVVDTISKDFPLGIMYWVNNEEGTYEILDGQQRTISISTYVSADNPAKGYSISGLFGNPYARTFSQLLPDEKEKILNYELLVYVCEGADIDRLRWFETINIAGEKLSDQEIRNAQYSGTWLTDAKRYFSKNNSAGQQHATKPKAYISLPAGNTWNRQGGLEKVLRWYIDNMKDTSKLEMYMSQHQNDENATYLWEYFQTVISWVKKLFPTYRKGMEKVEWGILYNKYHNNEYDLPAIQEKVATLYADEEVKDKTGIYEYIFDGKQSHLNLREFEDWQKQTMYERQHGICPECKKEGNKKVYDISEMHADHIKPWHLGGKTEIANGRMLCVTHNLAKGGSY